MQICGLMQPASPMLPLWLFCAYNNCETTRSSRKINPSPHANWLALCSSQSDCLRTCCYMTKMPDADAARSCKMMRLHMRRCCIFGYCMPSQTVPCCIQNLLQCVSIPVGGIQSWGRHLRTMQALQNSSILPDAGKQNCLQKHVSTT